jgi:MFS family permease
MTGTVVEGAGGRRAVRLLALARLASSGGSQAAQIALAFTIYERTSSAAWVSASLVASAGIVGLVGPLSGRLSDRHDRRRVMVLSEVAGAAGWLVVMLADSPATLVAAALVATAANAPFKAASGAAVPNLVGPGELTWANGTIATATNAALVAGPLVGGALVGVAGPRAVFGVNVASFLISAMVIARLPGRFSEDRTPAAQATPADPGTGRTEGDGPGTEASARAGTDAGAGAGRGAVRWRTVLQDPPRRRLYAVTTLSFAAFGVTLVADLPLVDELGGGSVAYALLTTLWGSGAVVGSALTTRLTVRHERLALVGGTAAMAVSLGSIAVMPNLPRGRWAGGRPRLRPVVLAAPAGVARRRARHQLRHRRDARAGGVRPRHGRGRRGRRPRRPPAHLPRPRGAPRHRRRPRHPHRHPHAKFGPDPPVAGDFGPSFGGAPETWAQPAHYGRIASKFRRGHQGP